MRQRTLHDVNHIDDKLYIVFSVSFGRINPIQRNSIRRADIVVFAARQCPSKSSI